MPAYHAHAAIAKERERETEIPVDITLQLAYKFPGFESIPLQHKGNTAGRSVSHTSRIADLNDLQQ